MSRRRVRQPDDQRRRWIKRLVVAGLVLLVLALNVDDWSRDFTATSAEIPENAAPDDPQPLYSDRPVRELVVAVRWAATRIGGWEYVGTAGEGEATYVIFTRTGRLLRFTDDITIHIRDLGARRVVSGVSQSRAGFIGDLGRNPRNLRRLFEELEVVVRNAAPRPAPFTGADA